MVLVRPDEAQRRRRDRRDALAAAGTGAQRPAGRVRSRRDPPAVGARGTASTTGSIWAPRTRCARRPTRSRPVDPAGDRAATRRRWCCSSSGARSRPRWRSLGGQIVDGVGGSSGPLGVRAAGALDGELAYLLGPALSKRTLFTGGALDPRGAGGDDPAALWDTPAHAEGWSALLEAAAKTVRALTVSVRTPHEIVVSGRLARLPELVDGAGRVAGRHRPGDRARSRCRERGGARRRAAGGRARGRRKCAVGRRPAAARMPRDGTRPPARDRRRDDLARADRRERSAPNGSFSDIRPGGCHILADGPLSGLASECYGCRIRRFSFDGRRGM